MVICIYCKKNYSTSTILSNHQKSANFCILIQNSLINNSEIKVKKFAKDDNFITSSLDNFIGCSNIKNDIENLITQRVHDSLHY